MPLMRIRSVEIVFEDDLSTCMELIVSDSDGSTDGVDDDQLQDKDDATIADLTDDDSVTITKDVVDGRRMELRVDAPEDVSELNDSGRFTEEACSSRDAAMPSHQDARLSRSSDAIVETDERRLHEYIDSNSESSDDTAICEDTPGTRYLTTTPHDPTGADGLHDSYELQYDSFVDMGNF